MYRSEISIDRFTRALTGSQILLIGMNTPREYATVICIYSGFREPPSLKKERQGIF